MRRNSHLLNYQFQTARSLTYLWGVLSYPRCKRKRLSLPSTVPPSMGQGYLKIYPNSITIRFWMKWPTRKAGFCSQSKRTSTKRRSAAYAQRALRPRARKHLMREMAARRIDPHQHHIAYSHDSPCERFDIDMMRHQNQRLFRIGL